MASSEPWITLRRNYDSALGVLQDPSREVYVATIGGEPAGLIVVVMGGAFRGYIQTVAVDPAQRGHGIGSRLIRFAEERILAETPNVFICVSSFNSRARELYARLGYEPVGELKDYVVRGYSELLLRKTVGPLADFPRGKSDAAAP
ncbi:MAG: GNAT family N-acetyltransferase [Elusimicrobia bacterium]|nr:GNAT family N-acetyltransferase [Elusimicrobiota bacterium]